jgi:hypothetical protein
LAFVEVFEGGKLKEFARGGPKGRSLGLFASQTSPLAAAALTVSAGVSRRRSGVGGWERRRREKTAPIFRTQTNPPDVQSNNLTARKVVGKFTTLGGGVVYEESRT